VVEALLGHTAEAKKLLNKAFTEAEAKERQGHSLVFGTLTIIKDMAELGAMLQDQDLIEEAIRQVPRVVDRPLRAEAFLRIYRHVADGCGLRKSKEVLEEALKEPYVDENGRIDIAASL